MKNGKSVGFSSLSLGFSGLLLNFSGFHFLKISQIFKEIKLRRPVFSEPIKPV
jgi:hypothetical protein